MYRALFQAVIAYLSTTCYFRNCYIIAMIINSVPQAEERLSLWVTNTLYNLTECSPYKTSSVGPHTNTHTHIQSFYTVSIHH